MEAGHQVPTGPDSHRQAAGFGARLFTFHDQPVVVLQRKAEPMYGVDTPRFEVLCPDPQAAADLLVEVSRLGTEMSLLRGQVISFTDTGFHPNAAGYTFLSRPSVPADEVVLPRGTSPPPAHHCCLRCWTHSTGSTATPMSRSCSPPTGWTCWSRPWWNVLAW